MNGVKKPRDEPKELDVYDQEETDRIFTLLEGERIPRGSCYAGAHDGAVGRRQHFFVFNSWNGKR